MKYILVICLCIAIGCSDGKSEDTPLDKFKLEGVWELEATRISPGGPVDWTEVSSKISYTFNSDATFSYEVPENTDYNKSGTFRVSESTLYLSYSLDDKVYNDSYYVELQNGKLILQFSGCIEECKERYIKK